ncbi:hypothetical protein GCM10009347_36400 [Shewanella algicola]|uniref:PEGA domain-containing protein n=1 Tax=Shewanella algicola TaxID=640633 RepID=A0A9X1Z9B9_9GAMM|nr:hypothetical protein [Shewanella algicola]MCL1106484.1 hypothetical protein [Shewanella algicola]GGP67609.1 hypothetical protein GCM10009347_36400 [Shewanella algicola]
MDRPIQYATLILICLFTLTACFGPTGKVRLKTDIDNAELFIDGEAKSPIGKDLIELELSAENHRFEIKALSENGEWRYYGSEDILIPEDVIIEKKINTKSVATEKRKKRLALEKKLNEANRLAEKVKDEFKYRQAAERGL